MNKKTNFARLKYEEQMVYEINSALRKVFKDPRLTMVSITHVELSSDYSQAKVFWDTFDPKNKGSIKEGISNLAGKMRKHLASVLDVRHTPKLEFVYDSQYEDAQKIEELIKPKND